MHNTLEFVAKYCNYNKKVIRTVSYTKVVQRLAFWILTTADDQGRLELPGTQEMYADILHTNRSTLNQELQKLKEAKAITVRGKKVKIKDYNYLKEVIDY